MIYLYCFARPAPALADAADQASDNVCGIDGGEVRIVALRDRDPAHDRPPVALVGLVPSAPLATAARLVEHDRVCTTALLRGCDVLPARFGQLFGDEAALANEYLGRATSLGPVWQRVAHAVEMSLTITAASPTPTGPASDAAATHEEPHEATNEPSAPHLDREAGSTGTGYAYLKAVAGPIRERQHTRERVEPFRIDLRRSAGELIRAEVVRSQSVPSVIGLSHLIDRAGIATYERVVGEVVVAHPLIRVLFSGPSAPYSFVSL